MILPTKHISPERSLIGIGGLILHHLDHPQTITRLWEQVRPAPQLESFEQFILALDLLYIISAIDFSSGLLKRSRQ